MHTRSSVAATVGMLAVIGAVSLCTCAVALGQTPSPIGKDGREVVLAETDVEPDRVEIVEIEGKTYRKTFMSRDKLARKFGEHAVTDIYDGYYLQEMPRDIEEIAAEFSEDPLVDSVEVLGPTTLKVFISEASFIAKYGSQSLDPEDGEYPGYLVHRLASPAPILPRLPDYPDDLPEVMELRTSFSRTYRNGDGTRTAVLSIQPTSVYEVDENGVKTWRDMTPEDIVSLGSRASVTEGSTYYATCAEIDNDGHSAYNIVHSPSENYYGAVGAGFDPDFLFPNHIYSRRAIQFDTDSVPDVVDITTVTLRTYITSAYPEDQDISTECVYDYDQIRPRVNDMHLWPENYDYVSGGGNDIHTNVLWIDCWDGTNYYASSSSNWNRSDGYHNAPFNAAGVSDFESHYEGGRYAVGVVDYYENNASPSRWEGVVLQDYYAALIVEYVLPCHLTLTPSSHDFGEDVANDGYCTSIYWFELTNDGGQTGSGSISIEGSNPGDFLCYSSTCAPFTLAPGATRDIGVRFCAQGEGSRSAILQVDGYGDCNDDSSNLYGTGVLPEIVLSPPSHDFGHEEVGECTSYSTFTLQNIGTGTAEGEVYIAGTNPGDFHCIYHCGDFDLSAGESQQIRVEFCPDNSGLRTAQLFAEGSNCNDDSSGLSGIGDDPPHLALDPTSWDFGHDPESDGICTIIKTFTLTNDGGGTATGSIGTSGTNQDEFQIEEGEGYFSLPEGQSKPIDVKFCAGGLGERTAQLCASGTNCNSPCSDMVGYGDPNNWLVSGRVVYENTDCGVGGIEIYLDDGQTSPPTITSPDGYYTMNVLSGEHTITPQPVGGHTFSPPFWFGTVDDDITIPDFEDQLTYTLSGKVVGGCDIPIGTADVSATSTPSCYSNVVQTSAADGTYSVSLPPLVYSVCADMNPVVPGVDFDCVQVDMTAGDQVVDFIHHNPVEIAFVGFPEPPGTCTVPVLEQWQEYEIEIHVFEQYGDVECPVDGELDVSDGIGDVPVSTIPVTEGIATYTIVAGEPNILDGSEHPYQKQFEVTLVGDGTTADQWVIVTGHKIIEGQTFTTITPEIPFAMLRDPPMDMSYSYLSEMYQTCYGLRAYFQAEGSVEVSAEAMIGLDLGIGNLGGSISSSVEVGSGVNTAVEFSMCTSATELFKTSDDQQFVGDDSDVFAGAAVNLEYTITQHVTVDEDCEVTVTPAIAYNGDGYYTTFVYTAHYVRDQEIPRLLALYEAEEDPVQKQIFFDSAQLWQEVLDLNDSLKEEAEFIENRSMNAGILYEYSETSTVTGEAMLEFYLWIDSEVAAEAGLEVFGTGAQAGAKVKAGFRIGVSGTVGYTYESTCGHVLQDDDQSASGSDVFSIDVLLDEVYGTRVFDLQSGESSCPWEPPTISREGVTVSVDPTERYHVPAADPAVFDLYLGNSSPTDEDRTYCLSIWPGSNPDGLTLKVDGTPLTEECQPFFVPAQETAMKTLEVWRGPVEYDYYDLGLVWESGCGDGQIGETCTISVISFDPDCSAPCVTSPEAGWVVNSTDSPELPIVVECYDVGYAGLQRIKVQYREVGTGQWYTVCTKELAELELEPDGFVCPWDTDLVDDGEYEVRALAECSGGSAGSDPVQGLIDRTCPEVVGTPSPQDHVLDPGDDIYFDFSETMDLLSMTASCISLVDDDTGLPITFTTSMNAAHDRVFIMPSVPMSELEGHTVTATVECVADEHGNELCEPVPWPFVVDLGPLHWGTVEILDTAVIGQSVDLCAVLTNTSGTTVSYSFSVCDYFETPAPGELPPGGNIQICFSFIPQWVPDTYGCTVYAECSGWPGEPLILEVLVPCGSTGWVVNPSAFQYNGSITAAVYLDGERVGAESDTLAAFVGEECRGKVGGSVPGSFGVLFFLTVYSNQASGEQLSFRYFWGEDCSVSDIIEKVEFVADMIVGTPSDPFEMNIDTSVCIEIPFYDGWNWFSLNVEGEDMSLNTVLASLDANDDDLIKSQTVFAQYASEWGGWFGTLTHLDTESLYKINLQEADTLEYCGLLADCSRPIELHEVWNWISCLTDGPTPVDEALVSIDGNGDYIKNQTTYAHYVPESQSWLGSLQQMSPLDGYMLRMHVGDELIYCPDSRQGQGTAVVAAATPEPRTVIDRWSVNPHAYEHSGTITATVVGGTGRGIAEGDVLAFFAGDECRGTASASQLPDGEWVFYSMVYSNAEEGGTVSGRFYDASEGIEYVLGPSVAFRSDMTLGRVITPFEFSMLSVADTSDEAGSCATALLGARPNPLRGGASATIEFSLRERQQVMVEIFNVSGARVKTVIDGELAQGTYAATWDGTDDGSHPVASGVYFCRMQAGDFIGETKMIVLR